MYTCTCLVSGAENHRLSACVCCRYQHSRQLVEALNRFADERADLPHGWEKKLNRDGKVLILVHMLMRDAEGKKTEESKAVHVHTKKQSNTTHPRQSLFQRKMSCFR